ncbi:glycosyltransferase family 39 protein [Roseateles sp.]|uniref:glycosyltransferase family 39 protein n=1 Tax=Roseateles sp. TaxID=1971397 RepID=UPI003BA4459D
MPGLELARGRVSDGANDAGPAAAHQVLPWGLDARNARHMAWLALSFMAFHLLLWTVLASLSHRAPPWDNVEQLVWQQSLEWGYYKHPPFPTWWVHAWTSLLGRSMWVTFFAAQLSVVLMQFFIWRIALLVTTPARAFVALALSSLLIYHGVHGIMANHNTIQLMPVGLLLWLSLLAVRAQGQSRPSGHSLQLEQLGRWVLVGAAAALCLLSKYSALIWMAVIGVWMLQDKRMHSVRAWLGVGLALLVCAALMMPHIDWLLRDGSPGLAYADRAVQGQNDTDDIDHWGRLFKFLLIQIGRVLPLLIGLGLLLAWLRRAAQPATAETAVLPSALEPKSEWSFVLFMALGPVLLTSLLGVAGVRLGSAWAATFFVMAGVLALYALRREQDSPQLVRKALWVCVGMELLLALGMVIGGAWGADRVGHAARSNFPAARLTRKLETVWEAHARTPLRVVIGETWLAGNVSVRSKTQPLVFIDADPQKSPWIKPHMLSDCGALLVIDRRDFANPLDPRVAALLDQASETGTVKVRWTRGSEAPKLEVQWAILEAKNPSACPL